MQQQGNASVGKIGRGSIVNDEQPPDWDICGQIASQRGLQNIRLVALHGWDDAKPISPRRRCKLGPGESDTDGGCSSDANRNGLTGSVKVAVNGLHTTGSNDNCNRLRADGLKLWGQRDRVAEVASPATVHEAGNHNHNADGEQHEEGLPVHNGKSVRLLLASSQEVGC
jgi:hypothetical protein